MLSILITVDLEKEYECEITELQTIFMKQIPEITSVEYQLDHKQAHSYFEEYKPNILLSSLEFIFCYGLQHLKAVCPGAKIIVCAEDSRAENIIQLYNQGIFRYLLHPNLLTKLMVSVRDCVRFIKEQNEKESTRVQNSRFINSILLDRVLYELVIHPDETAECLQALSNSPYDLKNMQAAVVASLSIGGIAAFAPEKQQEIYLQVRRFLQDFCGEYGIVFKIPMPRITQLVVIFGKFPAMPRWSRSKLLHVFRQQTQHFTQGQPFWLKIGVGPSVDKLEDLSISFDQSFDAMYLAFPFLRTVLVDCEQETAQQQQLTLPPHMIQQLIDTVDQPALFELELDCLIAYFNSQPVLLWGHLQIAAIKILSALHKQSCPELSVQIAKIYTLSDFRQFVLSIPKASNQKSTKRSSLIERAKYIILDRYSDPELNLQSVAQSSFTSPSYLSSIFKKEMGVSFVEYLSMVRVDKAKELCCQKELKVSEIAQLVGYQDPGYFSYCFKKIVGTSPSHYQKQLTENEPQP